jgi:NAD-dependent dihydropyrimidine dehydrogenase PreA subunit
MKRKIIYIDEEKCNGCGLCIPNCAEGAIKIIKGKAKLLDDRFCDGLGACLGRCPQNAIAIAEREAPEFDEKAAETHLKKEKNVKELQGCPGNATILFHRGKEENNFRASVRQESKLQNWPVQLRLISPGAPYFEDADLLVAADCVPFAYPNFHLDLLEGRTLVTGCPKLDDTSSYVDKLTEIFRRNKIKGVTIVNMEVPCCFGLLSIVKEALRRSGKALPTKQTIITINGNKQGE